MGTITENLREISAQIGNAKLIAVSKTRSIAEIREAFDAGQVDFGENKIQELLEKSQALQELGIRWHFIGHLQTNKISALRKVSGLVSIHSIDSINLLNKILTKLWCNEIGVFLQINTSQEAEKSGFSSAEEIELAARIVQDAPGFFLQGLMTIGSIRTSEFEEDAKRCFQKLVDIKSALDEQFGLDLELSMGMSSDYLIAVDKGSNWLRIGSAIFST